MRKKTTSRARKQDKASSSGKSKGLTAKNSTPRQSAGTKSALASRSHRTFWNDDAVPLLRVEGIRLLLEYVVDG
jgi:hypothetical protein